MSETTKRPLFAVACGRKGMSGAEVDDFARKLEAEMRDALSDGEIRYNDEGLAKMTATVENVANLYFGMDFAMTTADEIAPVPLYANEQDRMLGIQQRPMTPEEEADAEAFFKQSGGIREALAPFVFLSDWLSHMAAERADAAITRYPGKWPPPKWRTPGE